MPRWKIALSKTRVKFLVLTIVLLVLVDQLGLLVHLFEADYYGSFSYPLEINMEGVLGAMHRGTPPPVPPINSHDYRYRIRNAKKCRQDGDDFDPVVILYLVKSALGNRERRDAIRKSWGWERRFSDVSLRRVFVLGTSENASLQDDIDEEYARNKDIVQADFIDTYYNNTIKTMVGFKWTIENCPRAQFILFSDDDMYISTKNLLKFIRNPFQDKVPFRKRRSLLENKSNHRVLQYDPIMSAYDGRLLAGYRFFSSPMRHKMSKWYVTLSEYPYSMYPPYVTAGAYVMSYPALVDMYYVSMFTKYFKFDDVYLGIVAKRCGIVPLHNENFYFWKKQYTQESYAEVIASHGYGDPRELKKIWEEQRSLGHA